MWSSLSFTPRRIPIRRLSCSCNKRACVWVHTPGQGHQFTFSSGLLEKKDMILDPVSRHMGCGWS